MIVATTTCTGASHSGSLPGGILDQDADEALERAEDRPVQHDRPMPLAVLADVGRAEPVGQHEVHLERPALPVAADRVGQHEFELRAVEGALARVELRPRSRRRVVASISAASAWSHTASEPARFAGRSENLMRKVLEAEVAVDRGEQRAERHALCGDLVLAAEDVRVVLGEAAHAHDAVHGAGRLVAMA